MKPIKLLMPIVCALLPLAAMAQPGALDDEFGSGGIVSSTLGPGNNFLKAMALQLDGKIVVAGRTGPDAILARFNSDGSLDPSFGEEGKVFSNFGFDFNTIEAMALQPDGKFVAIIRGGTNLSDAAEIIVARYGTDGILDETFGENGIVTVETGFPVEVGRAVVLRPNGKIIAAIRVSNFSGYQQMMIAQFQPDGQLDSSFGDNGLQLASFGEGQDAVWVMALQPDEKIVVGGSLGWPGLGPPGYDFAIMRLHPDGSLDPGFGTEGVVITQIAPESNTLSSLALQPDGKILAIGSVSQEKIAVARYRTDGMLDPGFGTDGVVSTQIQNLNTTASASVLQPDGKIVVGGGVDDNEIFNINNFALLRYTPEGLLDAEFGNNGAVITEVSTSSNSISELAIQPDGKIVAGGGVFGARFVIARYLSGLEVATSSLPILKEAALAYPNPARQTVALRYALPAPGRISIQLLDMNGRLLKTFAENERRGPGAQEESINLPVGLSAGQYILLLSGAGGKTGVKINIQSR
ncbi:MAG: T9SS type A sorting domain-containing protein [Phaeodactylibacter sp.]|nr:T9SS type A sorting domain-containing protein [Phaeodactylibacter sp.]